MTSIPLSNEHGVNPSLEVCAQCGRETGVIAMTGRVSKWLCLECRREVYCRSDGKGCPRCGNPARMEIIERDVEMPSHISTGNLCAVCKTRNEEAEKAVKEGGVYWKCKDCKSWGAIKKEAPLAAHIREKLNKMDPEAYCAEFSKEDLCPICGPHKIEPPPPAPAAGPT